jgi:hypothetical protein
MDRLRLLNLNFVFAATAILSSICAAQTSQVSPDTPYPAKPVPSESSTMPYPAKPVPQAKPLTPFSTNSSSGIGHFIVYRPRDEMSESDRDLATKRSRDPGCCRVYAGIDFDKEKWSYRQLECQALPGHLFSALSREIAASVMRVFFPPRFHAPARAVSASFPWSGAAFLCSRPLPSTNSPWRRSIAFARRNRQRPAPDWLSTGLCYAALTEPRLESFHLAASIAQRKSRVCHFPPTLEVGVDGESTVRFVNVAEPRQPMQWALTFDAKGQLVKVEHLPHAGLRNQNRAWSNSTMLYPSHPCSILLSEVEESRFLRIGWESRNPGYIDPGTWPKS